MESIKVKSLETPCCSHANKDRTGISGPSSRPNVLLVLTPLIDAVHNGSCASIYIKSAQRIPRFRIRSSDFFILPVEQASPLYGDIDTSSGGSILERRNEQESYDTVTNLLHICLSKSYHLRSIFERNQKIICTLCKNRASKGVPPMYQHPDRGRYPVKNQGTLYTCTCNCFTYHRNIFLLELVLLALFGLLCAGSEIGRGIITGDALDLLLLRLGPTLRALRGHRCRARR